MFGSRRNSHNLDNNFNFGGGRRGSNFSANNYNSGAFDSVYTEESLMRPNQEKANNGGAG